MAILEARKTGKFDVYRVGVMSLLFALAVVFVGNVLLGPDLYPSRPVVKASEPPRTESGAMEAVIAANSDDGTEINDSEWYESGLGLGIDRVGLDQSGSSYTVGLRFQVDELEQGERVAFARLKFASRGSGISSGAQLAVEGVLQDSPTTFSSSDRPSQKLPKTETRVEWTVSEDWLDEPVFDMERRAPVYYYSADVSSIINEILSLPGWGSGPDGKTIILTVKDNGSRSGEDNFMSPEDYGEPDSRADAPTVLEVYPSVYDAFIGQELVAQPTNNSALIKLYSLLSADVYVQYDSRPGVFGQSTEPLVNQPAGAVDIQLNQLLPNTEYYYRLAYRKTGVGDYIFGEELSFHTKRAAGASFKFDITADEHYPYVLPTNQNRLALWQQTVSNIKASQPDFLISMGDFALLDWVEGREILNLDEARGRYINQRKVLNDISGSVPIYLVLGNHEGEVGWEYDYDNPGGNEDSLAVLGAKARQEVFANPSPGSFYGGNTDQIPELGLRQDYYSWQWGDALFVALDPFWYTDDQPSSVDDNWEWTLGQEQYNWLYNTIHNSSARWKFVFMHHMVSSNTVGGYNHYYGRGGTEIAKFEVAGMPSFEWGGEDEEGNDDFSARRPGWSHGPIHDMLVAEGVDVVFHGHDHFFAKQQLDGIIYQECPQPSDPEYSLGFEERGGYQSGIFLPNSGHLEVSVSSNTVTVNYIRSYLLGDGDNREVAHSYTLHKSTPVPPVKQKRYNMQ